MQARGVLILLATRYPSYAGASRRVEGLCYVLRKNGIDVTSLSYIPQEGAMRQDQTHAVSCLRAVLPRSTTLFTRGFRILAFWLLAFPKALKLALSAGLILQFQTLLSAPPALLAGIILRRPVIADDFILSHLVSKRFRCVLKWLDLMVIKLSSLIVTASLDTVTFTKSASHGRLQPVYMPNGITIHKSAEKMRMSMERGRSQQMIFVGSLSFSQNLAAVKNLIEVADALMATGESRFQFTVVGGPISAASQFMNSRAVEKRLVKFAGQVSDSQLEGIYAGSIAGLLPFFSDTPLRGGTRTKALEYFAHSLLVISGKEGVKGIHGLQDRVHYVEVPSVDKMAELIRQVILDRDRYQEIAVRGKRFVCERYTWDALSTQYVDCVRRLLRNQIET